MDVEMRGTAELQANLAKIAVKANPALMSGLELWANAVVTEMKRGHLFGKSLSPAAIQEHASERFYSWTSRLVNSMHAGKAKLDGTGSPYVEVLVTESYAASVEFGGPNSRAFPFVDPALAVTREAGLAIMVAASRRALGL